MDREKTFQHKKSLGQHFLNNTRIPEAMAEAGNVEQTDTILEIGPGTGALTKTLLARGATVIAVEADIRAVETLQQTFASEISAQKLVIIHGDVRALDIASLSPRLTPHGYKVIANIPYYLSGMLFRSFLESKIQPKTLVFLVQREVAERIAKDEKESLLSLSVKVFGDVRYVLTVKKGNFTPPPSVDSAIITVTNISQDRLDGVPEATFFALLHAGFASKRKQLLGNLSKIVPRDELIPVFSTLNLKLDVRGEDLQLSTWVLLAQMLEPHFSSK